MLNPFPIQFLALLAYLLLRVFVGAILLYLGIRHWQTRHTLKETLVLPWWPFGTTTTLVLIIAELVLGTLFILGAYTQYAALITMLICLDFMLFRHRFTHETLPARIFYVLLFGCALSLFITGAGALAFDLPI